MAEKTKKIAYCAIFTALNIILSQISIPIGPVPVNLTHISIFMAAGLLGAKFAALSQIIYVLSGVVGLPVFSGAHGGIAVVFEPTGGFIAGYILCAFISGLIIEKFGNSMASLLCAMTSGSLVTYFCGIIWFMYIMKMGLLQSLSICVFPFIIGDVLKAFFSAVMVNRLTVGYKITLINK